MGVVDGGIVGNVLVDTLNLANSQMFVTMLYDVI